MNEEVLAILKENNVLLKRILALIESKYNENIEDDIKDFSMNIVANLVASILEKNDNCVELIKDKFKI